MSLRPLQLGDQQKVCALLGEYPPCISEHTFTNLFVWSGSRPTVRAEGERWMAFAARREEGLTMLGPPVGEVGLAAALGALRENAEEPVQGLERLPESTLEEARAEGLEPQTDRDNFDYVYRRRDLAELPGRHLHDKRNLVTQCTRAHQCRYERITADLFGEVRNLQDRWCEEKDCGRTPGLCAEYNAIQRLLEHYEELDVVGGAVRVDGRLEAYTVGGRLNGDTAVVHFEKAMTALQGLYQVINQWFCRQELGEFEYVNREQDLGIPGIRRAKQSYRPDHMVRKYKVALAAQPLRATADEGRCRE